MFPLPLVHKANRDGTSPKSGLFTDLMSHGPAQKIAPRDPRLRDAWRAACLEYRQCRREGHHEAICYHNARATLWRAVPELSYDRAAEETTLAISYASVVHPKWLWSRTASVPPRPKMPFVPPHIIKDPHILWQMEKEGEQI